jgi:hypothetical protein
VAIPKKKIVRDRLLSRKHTSVEERHQLVVIINLDALLLPSNRVRNVELHFSYSKKGNKQETTSYSDF